MPTVTLEEAQARLPQLIEQLQPGEAMVITRDLIPVAKLLAEGQLTRKPRKPGSAKGKLFILQEDKDHLQDFEEYM